MIANCSACLLVGLHDGGPVDGGGDKRHHVDEETEDELLEGGEERGPQRQVLVSWGLVIEIGHLRRQGENASHIYMTYDCLYHHIITDQCTEHQPDKQIRTLFNTSLENS